MFAKKSSSRIFSFLFVAVSLLALMFSAIGVTPARAATLIVTNTADSGPGSLRQTISDAAAGDTITFDPSLAGQTISATGSYIINKDLTINGPSASSHIRLSRLSGYCPIANISAGSTINILNLDFVNASCPTIISGVVITTDGGGIYNAGTLTIQNSSISSNRATNGAGVYNTGTLSLNNVIVSSNNGGSTRLGNHGRAGSGVYNTGTLSVTNSTFSSN